MCSRCLHLLFRVVVFLLTWKVSKQEILSCSTVSAHTLPSVHYLVAVNIYLATLDLLLWRFFSQETCKTTSWAIIQHTIGTKHALHIFLYMCAGFNFVFDLNISIQMHISVLWGYITRFIFTDDTSFHESSVPASRSIMSSREEIKMPLNLAVRLLNDASIHRVKQPTERKQCFQQIFPTIKK